MQYSARVNDQRRISFSYHEGMSELIEKCPYCGQPLREGELKLVLDDGETRAHQKCHYAGEAKKKKKSKK